MKFKQAAPKMAEILSYKRHVKVKSKINPLRGKLAADLAGLNQYPYCGHSALMGVKERLRQGTEYVREDLVGGGLIRSLGGWAELKAMRLKGRNRVKGDERILGDTDFVMEVLAEANEAFDRRYKLKSFGYDVEKVAGRVSEIYGIDPKELFPRGRQKIRVEARSLLCYWAVHDWHYR